MNLREIAEDQNKKEGFRFKALDLLIAVFQRKHVYQNFCQSCLGRCTRFFLFCVSHSRWGFEPVECIVINIVE